MTSAYVFPVQHESEKRIHVKLDKGAEADLIRSLPGALFDWSRLEWTLPWSPSSALELMGIVGAMKHRRVEDSIADLAARARDEIRETETLLRQSDLPDYPSLTKAWDHQKKAYYFALNKRAAYLAMVMGSGKSKVVVDLCVNRGHSRILVSPPKKAMAVWPREFLRHAGNKYDVHVYDGPGEKKARKIRFDLDVADASRRPVVVVINHESLWRSPVAETLKSYAWDLVVIDEAHRAKDPDGKFSRYLPQLAITARYRLMLSGTPYPYGPLDIFAQYRFLDSGIFGSSYPVFKKRYDRISEWIVRNPLRVWRFEKKMIGGSNLKNLLDVLHMKPHQLSAAESGKGFLTTAQMKTMVDLTGDETFPKRFAAWKKERNEIESTLNNEEDYTRRVGSIMVSINEDEANLGLLEPDYEFRELVLEKSVQAAYDEMEQTFRAEIGKGVVSTNHALTMIMRLCQIASGHAVYDDGRKELVSDHKRKALIEELEDLRGLKVVVFCRFTHDLAVAREVLEDDGRRVAELSGAQNDLDDDACFPEWADAMVVMIQSGGVGVDLTRAYIAIDYSTGWSLTDWLQSRKRLDRPPQKMRCKFISFQTMNTIEPTIYRTLSRRENIVDAVIQKVKDGHRTRAKG